MPNLPPLINSPRGSASAVIASAIAKQRSAWLHLFQSEIQSRIQRPPDLRGHLYSMGVEKIRPNYVSTMIKEA